LSSHLASVAPGNVLKRGYTYTLGPDGHVLRSAAAVAPGDRIATVLADGKLHSRVEGADAPVATPRPPRVSTTTRPGKRKPTDADPGLFS
jgi:exodeoxyribonuclease VII large subunit